MHFRMYIVIAQELTAWLKWPTLRLLSKTAPARRARLPSKGAPPSTSSPASPPLVVASTAPDGRQAPFRDWSWAKVELTLEEAFGLAKGKISKAFRRLSEQLTASEGFLKDIESAKQQNVAPLGVKVQGIKDMLARNQMKVVFFGRTSNGDNLTFPEQGAPNGHWPHYKLFL